MSKILFIVPVFTKDLLHECGGTLLLATILKEKGMDVDLYRYYESGSKKDFNLFLENSVKNILSKDPRIVSFYCRGDVYLANILVAKKIKEIRPEIHIVFGGPQADIAAALTLQQIPWVDYCCSGEGETTVFPLFNALLNREDVTSVRGLTYRTADGEVVSNPRPDLIENLDTLPLVDYAFLPQDLINEIKANPIPISIDVGRGCPYNCAYCSTSLFWQRKFRIKSPERIVAEIKRLYDEFGITQFSFDHDLFTASKSRILDFCRVYKESGLDIKWACSSRADTIDKETIDAMVSAGLERIYLGVETGSERMQKIIHKNLNIEKTIETIKYLVDKGIRTTVSLIYGFPEETYDDIEDTLQLAYNLRKYGVTTFQFHLCSIFPGTEYFEKYKDELEWATNPTEQSGNFGVNENIDFIREHKDLFPFYYEYHNEIRSRLYGIQRIIKCFMELYDYLKTYDPQKVAAKRMVDIYLDFIDVNKNIFDDLLDINKETKPKTEFFSNYLASVYDPQTAQKVMEIMKFKEDLYKIKSENKDASDVRVYNIDINAVIKEKELKDIASRTSMVCITVVNKKVSCGVQYLN